MKPFYGMKRWRVVDYFFLRYAFGRVSPEHDLVRHKMLHPVRELPAFAQLKLKEEIRARLRKTRRVRHKLVYCMHKINGEYTFVYK